MQMIILCINSTVVSPSVIIAQLIIFLICKLSVLRGNLSYSKKLENDFLVLKFCSMGEELMQPMYLYRYFENEHVDSSLIDSFLDSLKV